VQLVCQSLRTLAPIADVANGMSIWHGELGPEGRHLVVPASGRETNEHLATPVGLEDRLRFVRGPPCRPSGPPVLDVPPIHGLTAEAIECQPSGPQLTCGISGCDLSAQSGLADFPWQ
jgi:hypothetical protein